MIGSLIERLRSWWAVEDSEDRIVGSGDPILDPAYNERYTAERRLQQCSTLDTQTEDEPSEHRS